jgi:hypothetical protein
MESAEDGGGGVLLCHCVVVVGTISSEGVAFQLTFGTSQQNPGDKLCRDVRNVA